MSSNLSEARGTIQRLEKAILELREDLASLRAGAAVVKARDHLAHL